MKYLDMIFVTATISLATSPFTYAESTLPMVKPLQQYTAGDLVPRLDAELETTAEIWKTVGTKLRATAIARQDSVAEGLELVKQRMNELEEEVKVAKKAKDFTAEGTARGALETEETVYKILKALDSLSDNQRAVADSWSSTAEAIEGFVAADTAFDAHRARGIAKPVAGGTDTRLDPPAVDSFRKQARSMDDLGNAFEKLGEELQSLAKEREALLSQLKKGGHTLTPVMASGQ